MAKVSHYKQLKNIAKEHNIEVPPTTSVKGLEDLLTSNNVSFPSAESGYVPTSEKPNMSEIAKRAKEICDKYSRVSKTKKYRDRKGRLVSEPVDEFELRRTHKELKKIKDEIRSLGSSGKKLLMEILLYERQRKIINVSDLYNLYEYEAENTKLECECYNKIGASGFHVQVGEVYKYITFYDPTRETQMYVVFARRKIAPEAQMNDVLARKVEKGHNIEPNEWPKEKILYRGFPLVESQFIQYFREA